MHWMPSMPLMIASQSKQQATYCLRAWFEILDLKWNGETLPLIWQSPPAFP